MEKAHGNSSEVAEDHQLDRMEKELAWCLYAKMDWKGVIGMLEPLMQRKDCMLHAWCATLLGGACGMIGHDKKSHSYYAAVQQLANDTQMDQGFAQKSLQLATRKRAETGVCEILYHLGRLTPLQPREYLEEATMTNPNPNPN